MCRLSYVYRQVPGSLSRLNAVELGAIATRAALERCHVDPSSVDFVYMGYVIRAGTGQDTARQARSVPEYQPP